MSNTTQHTRTAPKTEHHDLNKLSDRALRLETDYLKKHLTELHSEIVGPWVNVSVSRRRLGEDYALSAARLEVIYGEMQERGLR